MKINKHHPNSYPSDFYQDIPPDFHNGDGRHSPQSLIGGFRGYLRSFMPPPYDSFPYDEDGSVMMPCYTGYANRLEEIVKKEAKKRAKKKGVWTKSSDPYPWEQSTKGDEP